MRKKYLIGLMSLVMLFGSMAAMANASTISVTVGSFDGPGHTSGFPYTYDLPDFYFVLGGETIVSASLSGIWGVTDTYSGSTAHNEVWLDGIKVADTHDATPDPYYNNVPWAYTYSDFSTLLDGHLNYSVVQTSPYVVRLGATTLNIETKPHGATVPEPATMLLLGSVLTGLAGTGLLKKKQ